MLRIKIEKGDIERALRTYKYKVNKTKQTMDLRDNRYHTKENVSKRRSNAKAKYIQQLRDQDTL